jgi:hypothetical protein
LEDFVVTGVIRITGVAAAAQRLHSQSTKAQGQSVKHIEIDLHVPVFSHGQLYMVLSRATNSQNIQVLLPEEDRDNCQTQNVMYPEVLADTPTVRLQCNLDTSGC